MHYRSVTHGWTDRIAISISRISIDKTSRICMLKRLTILQNRIVSVSRPYRPFPRSSPDTCHRSRRLSWWLRPTRMSPGCSCSWYQTPLSPQRRQGWRRLVTGKVWKEKEQRRSEKVWEYWQIRGRWMTIKKIKRFEKTGKVWERIQATF